MFVIACALRVCGQEGAVVMVDEPVGAVTNVGGVASFRAVATGLAPILYQWLRDGQELAGATGAILVISPVGLNQTGQYQVRVRNAGSSVASRLVALAVNPATAQPIVDPLFRGDARLNTMPTHVQVLANGGVVLGPALDGRVVRLRADGDIDSSFAPGRPEPPFGRSAESRIDHLIEQPDGRLLVAGNFATYERRLAPGLVRLNRDGSRDETFAPGAEVELWNLLAGDITRRVALQADGKILVLSTRGLLRLLADGRLDPAFVSPVATTTNIAAFAVGRGDCVYVGLTREQVVTRLLPDGGEDPSYLRRAVDVHPSMKLYPLADGRLLVNSVRFVAARPVSISVWSLARWLEDGAMDATFPVLALQLPTAPAPDGTLYFTDGSIVGPDGTRGQLALGFGQFDSPVSTTRFRAVFGPDARLYLFGGFSFYNGVSSSRVVRINRVPAGGREVEQAPRILAAWADATTLALGQTTVLRVAPVAPGPVTYEWRRLNREGSLADSDRTNTPRYEFSPRYLTEPGTWAVRVLNAAGEALSASMAIALEPAALRIVAQPMRVALAPDRLGSLHVELSPYSEVTQASWIRDGLFLSRVPNQETGYPRALENGATDVWLELGPVTAAMAGTYFVTVTNVTGHAVTSQPIIVTVATAPRFVNLSTRAFVGEGEQATVLGFVIPPGSPRGVVVRGIGPTLAQFGVADALADAQLELFDQLGWRMAVNDHWREIGSGTDFARFGAFALSPESKDAMLAIGGLTPGAYTVRLSGPPGVTGNGLIELYEADERSDRFVNLSSRVYVSPSGAPAIAGLAIRGPGGKRVLVRAAGPALAAFGVTGPLANPRLEVRDASGALLATNDDWSQPSEAGEVARAAAAVGAFGFVAGSRDAALVITLPEGNFTVLVSGAAPTDAGVALIEVYEVP